MTPNELIEVLNNYNRTQIKPKVQAQDILDELDYLDMTNVNSN